MPGYTYEDDAKQFDNISIDILLKYTAITYENPRNTFVKRHLVCTYLNIFSVDKLWQRS